MPSTEYEVVVSEKSRAERYGRQRVAPLLRRGVWGNFEKNTCLCGIWSYLSGSTAVLINQGYEQKLTKDHEQAMASFYHIK